jgi:hypothetical protein
MSQRSSASIFALTAMTAMTGCLALAFTFACGSSDSGDSQSGGIENSALAISISKIPEPFQLETNEGESLTFTSSGLGHLEFQVGPIEETGINLVTEVKKRKAHFEALPDGTYLGNTELGTQLGTAFSARGRYESDGDKQEETWIYALHPTSDRLLTLTYRYPAEVDSQERVQQLLSILGEVVAQSGAGES